MVNNLQIEPCGACVNSWKIEFLTAFHSGLLRLLEVKECVSLSTVCDRFNPVIDKFGTHLCGKNRF